MFVFTRNERSETQFRGDVGMLKQHVCIENNAQNISVNIMPACIITDIDKSLVALWSGV
jgi:hypothetical protein